MQIGDIRPYTLEAVQFVLQTTTPTEAVHFFVSRVSTLLIPLILHAYLPNAFNPLSPYKFAMSCL
jgi:hypothetical protein